MSGELAVLVPVMGAIFHAALVHGLAGFGAALVAMPLLSLVLSVKFVAPLVALLTLTVNLLLLLLGRKDVSLARVLPLAAGAFPDPCLSDGRHSRCAVRVRRPGTPCAGGSPGRRGLGRTGSDTAGAASRQPVRARTEPTPRGQAI